MSRPLRRKSRPRSPLLLLCVAPPPAFLGHRADFFLPLQEIHDLFPVLSHAGTPSPPTPELPAPLPHHDVDESSKTQTSATEVTLQGVAATEFDDAALFEQGEEQEDDGWGLNADADEAVSSDLLPVESFSPEAREAELQELDLPLETTFVNPQPATEDNDDDGFADFTPRDDAHLSSSHHSENAPARSPFLQQPAAWEPFEEESDFHPSGVANNPQHHDEYEHEHDAPPSAAQVAEAEQLIQEEATVPLAALEELHQLVDADPPVEPSSEQDTTPTREGGMSSPEVIEHSDAWGFDGEAPQQDEGAEVLDGSVDEPANPALEHNEESTVQHQDERPALHDESAVQHVARRHLVQPEDEDEAIVLPVHDAHPQQRTFSPSPEAVPAETDEADGAAGWDLGEEEAVIETVKAEQEQAEPVKEEQTEVEQLGIEEPLVEQDAAPPVVATPVAVEATPVAVEAPPAANNDEFKPSNEGAEVLEAAEEVGEQPHTIEGESTVQHLFAREVAPSPPSPAAPLPAQLAQVEEHTFSPPPSALPAEEDAVVDDPWDLDPVEPSATVVEPAAAEVLEATPAEPEPVEEPSHPGEKSAVQHIDERPVVETTDEPDLAAADPQPQDHTFSPPPSALPVAEEPSGWDVDLEVAPQEEKEESSEQSVDAEPSTASFSVPSVVALAAAPIAAAAAAAAPLAHAVESALGLSIDDSAKEEPTEDDDPEADWGWSIEKTADEPFSSPPTSFDPPSAPRELPVEAIAPASPPAPVAPPPRTPSPPPAPAAVVAPRTPSPPPKPVAAAATAVPSISRTAPTTPPPAASQEESTEVDDWGWDGNDDSPKKAVEPANGKVVSPEPEPEPVRPETPGPPPVRREKMMVSTRSKEIVRIAEEVLLEALEVASPSCVLSSFPSFISDTDLFVAQF